MNKLTLAIYNRHHNILLFMLKRGEVAIKEINRLRINIL